MSTQTSRFSGEVAVVTGGGDAGDMAGVGLGIGATICETLAAQGCVVAVLDRDLDLAKATAARIEQSGGHALAVRADVSAEAECRDAVQEVVSTCGRVDVLVNNVGIESFPPQRSGESLFRAILLPDVAEEDWDRTMAVNVKGMMLMAKHCAPHFGAQAGIVNIASIGAFRPHKGTAAYSTSKGAVVALTAAMAVELAPVRANCVSPGQVWTPIVLRKLPKERVAEIRADRMNGTLVGTEGTAHDIANAVAFLASNEARWITGQSIDVDGGRLLSSGMSPRSSGWALDEPA